MTKDTAAGNDDAPDNSSVDGELDELSVGYALGVLDEGETLAAGRLIEESPDFRAMLQRDEETAGLLGLAVPQTRPPDGLRQRVMAGAERSEPIRIESYRKSRLVRWGAAAAALIILGLITVNVVLLFEVVDRGDTISEQNAQLARMRQAALLAGVSLDWEQPLVWTPLTMNNQAASGEGWFARAEDGSYGWVIVNQMPLEPNSVYQAWLITGDSPNSGGTFAADENGNGIVVLAEDSPLQSFDTVGITVEPSGGSPQPTSAPVMAAAIP